MAGGSDGSVDPNAVQATGDSGSASVGRPRGGIAAGQVGAAEFEHLQWLGARDQQVLCRGECANALREEGKLLAEMRSAIFAHTRAIEHCKSASESDPDWFTLDVQDCHNRKVRVLREVLDALEADVPPAPRDADMADRVFGGVFNGYAKSAQAWVEAKDSEQVQTAAANVRSAFGAIRRSFLEVGQVGGGGGSPLGAAGAAPPVVGAGAGLAATSGSIGTGSASSGAGVASAGAGVASGSIGAGVASVGAGIASSSIGAGGSVAEGPLQVADDGLAFEEVSSSAQDGGGATSPAVQAAFAMAAATAESVAAPQGSEPAAPPAAPAH